MLQREIRWEKLVKVKTRGDIGEHGPGGWWFAEHERRLGKTHGQGPCMKEAQVKNEDLADGGISDDEAVSRKTAQNHRQPISTILGH